MLSDRATAMEEGDVRFGSKADICAATTHVRFTPNSDRESEIPQKAMSALHPKTTATCIRAVIISTTNDHFSAHMPSAVVVMDRSTMP
jgi:ABC-type glutathione transport system ATPase component